MCIRDRVDYSTCLAMLQDGKVGEVQVDETQIAFSSSDETSRKIYVTGRMEDEKLVDRLNDANVRYGRVVQEEMSPLLSFLLSWVFPILIFWVLGQFLFKQMSKRMGGNTMSFGKSNAKVYVAAQTGKTFNDVAGQDEAKEALTEIVDFLHQPEKYKDIGAKLPKGCLLYTSRCV